MCPTFSSFLLFIFMDPTPENELNPNNIATESQNQNEPIVEISTSVAPPELTKEEKREKKRMLVMNEIVSSEKTYVSRLRVTVDVFMTPLRENSILSPIEIEGQFGPLVAIRAVHETLLADLTTAQSNGTLQIGKVFKQVSHFFKMYQSYLACFEGAILRRAKLVTSNRRFSDFLEAASVDPRCMGMSFESFLVEPVQRVPRYRLLLEELLKCTSEDNPDHADIVAALDMVY
jgi:hypothetical protein